MKIYCSILSMCVAATILINAKASEVPFSLSDDLSFDRVKESISKKEKFQLINPSDKKFLQFDLKDFTLSGVEFDRALFSFFDDQLMRIDLLGGGSSLILMSQTQNQYDNIKNLRDFYANQGETIIKDRFSEVKTFKDLLRSADFIIFSNQSPCAVTVGIEKIDAGTTIATIPKVSYIIRSTLEKFSAFQDKKAKENDEKTKSLLK